MTSSLVTLCPCLGFGSGSLLLHTEWEFKPLFSLASPDMPLPLEHPVYVPGLRRFSSPSVTQNAATTLEEGEKRRGMSERGEKEKEQSQCLSKNKHQALGGEQRSRT